MTSQIFTLNRKQALSLYFYGAFLFKTGYCKIGIRCFNFLYLNFVSLIILSYFSFVAL